MINQGDDKPSVRSIGMAAGLLALVVMVFWPALDCEFVGYDDQEYVVDHALVNAGLTAEGFKYAFTEAHHFMWHPLTTLSHMADCEFFGVSSRAHHAVNLALHAVNAVLFFLILARLFGRLELCLIAALLFALHPLRVESVAWVSARKDLLCTLFWMLTIGAYLLYAEKPGWRRMTLVSAVFALGIMTRPTIVTLPFALLLLDVWPLNRWRLRSEASESADPPRAAIWNRAWPLVREKLPLFALAALLCVITVSVHSVAIDETLSFGFRLQNALVSYARYVGKFLAPLNLSVFYPFPEAWPAWTWSSALAFISAMVWLVCWRFRRAPYLAVGWFWFLGTLVPVIGIVAVGDHAIADRYTYVPHIGLLIMLVGGAAQWASRRPDMLGALRIGGVAAALACILLTRHNLAFWQNTETLWRRALEVTDRNARAHSGLGAGLIAQGRIAEAREHLVKADALEPDTPEVLHNLTILSEAQGDLRSALGYLERSVALYSNSGLLYAKLGVMRARLGEAAGARQAFQRSIELAPDFSAGRFQFGEFLRLSGEHSEARTQYREALRLDPGFVRARVGLAATLNALGHHADAGRESQAALKQDATSAEALLQTALALAGLGRTNDALRAVKGALQLDSNLEEAKELLKRLISSEANR